MAELDLFQSPISTENPTVVVNISDRATEFDVYIGRAIPSRGLEASPWANPFKIEHESERPQAVAKFEQWLRNSPALMARLRELKGKRLGCWCAPKACHGHVLARLADELPDTAKDKLEHHLKNRLSFRWSNGRGTRERSPAEWLAWLQHLGHIPKERATWAEVTDVDANRVLAELDRVNARAEEIRAERDAGR